MSAPENIRKLLHIPQHIVRLSVLGGYHVLRCFAGQDAHRNRARILGNGDVRIKSVANAAYFVVGNARLLSYYVNHISIRLAD